MSMHRLNAAVLLLFIACIACSDTTGGQRTSGGGTGTEFLYVSNQNANTISSFTINTSNGFLTQATGSPFVAGGSGPGRGVVDPASHFLFVVNQNSASVTSYRIANDGRLTTVNTVTAGITPLDIVVHPSKSAVYAVNEDGTVSGFSYDSFGSLFALPGSPYALNGGSSAAGRGIAIDPGGQFVYATSIDGISIFQVNSDSTLTLRANSAAPVGTDLRAIVAVPNSKSIYAADFGVGTGATGRIYGFSAANLAAGGASTLTQLPGTPVSDGINPASLAITPSGKLLYVGSGEAGAGQIRAYAINADGSLTQLSGTFSSLPSPVQIIVDPAGTFLYSANPSSVGSTVGDNVSVFTIDSANGMLTRINGSPFSVSSPAGLAIAKP